MSRTSEDKQNNGGRIYIAKNRNGPDGNVYSIFMDPENVDIKVLEKYDPSEKSAQPSMSNEEQQKFLLEKYIKLVKGAN